MAVERRGSPSSQTQSGLCVEACSPDDQAGKLDVWVPSLALCIWRWHTLLFIQQYLRLGQTTACWGWGEWQHLGPPQNFRLLKLALKRFGWLRDPQDTLAALLACESCCPQKRGICGRKRQRPRGSLPSLHWGLKTSSKWLLHGHLLEGGGPRP